MTDHAPPPGEKKYWLDDPKNVDKVFWSVVVVCAMLFVADAFYEKHPYFKMEYLFGFYGLFGFVACVGLVLAAKELRKLIMRGEDYYEKRDDDDAGDRN